MAQTQAKVEAVGKEFIWLRFFDHFPSRIFTMMRKNTPEFVRGQRHPHKDDIVQVTVMVHETWEYDDGVSHELARQWKGGAGKYLEIRQWSLLSDADEFATVEDV